LATESAQEDRLASARRTLAWHRSSRVATMLFTPTAVSVVALMTVVGAAYLALSWTHRAPMVYADEAGTLGNARWLAGGPTWWIGGANQSFLGIETSSSRLGYEMLIAPVFALVHSPVAIYRVVMAVNAVLCAVLAGLLYLIARKVVQAPPKVALGASLIACAYPAIAVQSGIAWVETTAMVAVAAFVLTGWLMFERPRYATMLSHALAAVYLWFVHGRFVAVPVVLLVLLGYVAVRQQGLRVPAIVTMAATLAALVAGHLALSAVGRARWNSGAKPLGAHSVLAVIPTGWSRTLVGQLWYLLVATAGLALVGAIAMARAFPGIGVQGRAVAAIQWLDRRLGAVYLLTALGSVVAVSSLFLARFITIYARPGSRNVHLYIQGRYDDSLTPTLLAVGIAVLVARRQRRSIVVRSLWIASGAILAVGLLLLAIRPRQGYVGQISFPIQPGIRAFFADPQDPVHRNAGILAVTAGATAAVALLALAARRLRWSLGVVVLCVFLFGAVTDVSIQSKVARNDRAGTAAYFTMRARDPRIVAYDLDHRTVFGYFGMPYWLNKSTFVSFRSSKAGWPQADMYIGPRNWPQATRHGLHRLVVDPLSGQGAWVR
jgi:hypothetical protein